MNASFSIFFIILNILLFPVFVEGASLAEKAEEWENKSILIKVFKPYSKNFSSVQCDHIPRDGKNRSSYYKICHFVVPLSTIQKMITDGVFKETKYPPYIKSDAYPSLCENLPRDESQLLYFYYQHDGAIIYNKVSEVACIQF